MPQPAAGCDLTALEVAGHPNGLTYKWSLSPLEDVQLHNMCLWLRVFFGVCGPSEET